MSDEKDMDNTLPEQTDEELDVRVDVKQRKDGSARVVTTSVQGEDGVNISAQTKYRRDGTPQTVEFEMGDDGSQMSVKTEYHRSGKIKSVETYDEEALDTGTRHVQVRYNKDGEFRDMKVQEQGGEYYLADVSVDSKGKIINGLAVEGDDIWRYKNGEPEYVGQMDADGRGKKINIAGCDVSYTPAKDMDPEIIQRKTEERKRQDQENSLGVASKGNDSVVARASGDSLETTESQTEKTSATGIRLEEMEDGHRLVYAEVEGQKHGAVVELNEKGIVLGVQGVYDKGERLSEQDIELNITTNIDENGTSLDMNLDGKPFGYSLTEDKNGQIDYRLYDRDGSPMLPEQAQEHSWTLAEREDVKQTMQQQAEKGGEMPLNLKARAQELRFEKVLDERAQHNTQNMQNTKSTEKISTLSPEISYMKSTYER